MRQQWVTSGQWLGSTGLDQPAAAPRVPAAQARRSGRHSVQSVLAASLRDDVLPRLVLAHRAMTAAVIPLSGSAPAWTDAVVELSRLAMAQDSAAATAFADRLLDDGMTVEDIYLDVLAPTARRLGALWAEDGCDIADVTLGVWRLHDVLRSLRPRFQAEASTNHGRPILRLPAPGETHSFGLAMVSDFFVRAGWNVSGGPLTADRDLAEWVGQVWFAVVGFSVGCDASLDALSAGIRIVRRFSRNRSVRVMVGGPIFALHPEMAARVGADATAVDGRQAVAQANCLVSLPGGKHE